MNLYSRKQRIKLALLLVAALIVGVSLWYSNTIVGKIREEERNKIVLWSEAVKQRIALLDYTRELFESLRQEERNKIKLWARATERIPQASNEEIEFLLEITTNNTTVPVLITDAKGRVSFWRNVSDSLLQNPQATDSLLQVMRETYAPISIEIYPGITQYLYYQDSRIILELEETLDNLINSFISETVLNSASVPVIMTDSTSQVVYRSGNVDKEEINSPEELQKRLAEMRSANEPIPVTLGAGETAFIYFESSFILTQLQYYPLAQIIIIGLFLFITYLIFSTFRNAEQNQVWIGMAKETAHQLGTPLSSLMAWVQILPGRGADPEVIEELNKDVHRLEVITDRFSKIGSQPEMELVPVRAVIDEALSYMRPRVSKRVVFDIVGDEDETVKAYINKPLFGWVFENLLKNAVDAMEGAGTITVNISHEIQNVYIDLTDTGKGIPAHSQKVVFEPGYTTKKRGWGLGLSLAKRIIENYHSGKIFVKRSEVGVGTTFRIVLKARLK